MLVVVQTSKWKFSLLLRLRTRYIIQKQTCLLKVLVIHIIFRANFWLNLKNSWKESSNIYTTWKVSHTRVLLVLTHHFTWFISLDWNGLFQFFQEFACIIYSIFSSIACHYQGRIFIFLKSKCPIFHFVYLDGTIFYLICKCAKKSKLYEHLMFSVFFLKTQAGLWNLFPKIDTKIDSQHAVN